jgi:hypothetical protein
MFHLPTACRATIVSCAVTADKDNVRVMVIRDKGKDCKDYRFFIEPINGFPTKSLLGKLLLYLQ